MCTKTLRTVPTGYVMVWTHRGLEHLNCGTYALLLSIWLTVSPCDVSYSIVGGQGPAVLIVS